MLLLCCCCAVLCCAGARPDEAVSWGKIRADAKPIKVHGDASILFPLLVSQTFAKELERRQQQVQPQQPQGQPQQPQLHPLLGEEQQAAAAAAREQLANGIHK